MSPRQPRDQDCPLPAEGGHADDPGAVMGGVHVSDDSPRRTGRRASHRGSTSARRGCRGCSPRPATSAYGSLVSQLRCPTVKIRTDPGYSYTIVGRIRCRPTLERSQRREAARGGIALGPRRAAASRWQPRLPAPGKQPSPKGNSRDASTTFPCGLKGAFSRSPATLLLPSRGTVSRRARS
jgi:hypothetical protein